MARREPRWVAVFLKQLERSGNVRLAAEGAGVDFSTAYQRRKRHGEFAEAWALRLAAFSGRSGQAGSDERTPPPSTCRSMVPLPTASPQGGAEVVLRPDGKVIKGSDARWGKRAEERFLTELTVSGSVRFAAKAAGFSTTAVYKRRLKSQRFAAAWDAALEAGKARVQSYLVEAATRTFDPDELPIGDEREIPKVSIGEAINIAKLGPSTGSGRAGKAGTNGGDDDFDAWPVTKEEYELAMQRIVDRLARIRERDEARDKCPACGQPLREE
jgi:hypothetical protein